MEKYSAVIVEDEYNAQIALKGLLEEYCSEVKVVETFSSVSETLEKINSISPDIIFLDIHLSDGTGFNIFSSIDTNVTKVIFTTAHDQYAIEAFNVKAEDYLLKPIDPMKLEKAVSHVINKIDKEHKSKSIQFLGIPIKDLIKLTDVNDIVRCEANSNYSYVYTKKGESMLVAKTLKKFEDKLGKLGFLRVHHSHIINISCIFEVRLKENIIVLNNDIEIPISRKYRMHVIESLKFKLK